MGEEISGQMPEQQPQTMQNPVEASKSTAIVPVEAAAEAQKPKTIEETIRESDEKKLASTRQKLSQNIDSKISESASAIVEKETKNEKLIQTKDELLSQYKTINELHGNLRNIIHEFNTKFLTLKEQNKVFFEENNINNVEAYISFFGDTKDVIEYSKSKREILERVSGIKKEDGKVVEVGEGEVDKTRAIKTELAKEIGVDPKANKADLVGETDATVSGNVEDIKIKKEEVKKLDGERITMRFEEAFESNPQVMEQLLSSVKEDIEKNLEGHWSHRGGERNESLASIKSKEIFSIFEKNLLNNNLSAEDFSKYGKDFVADILNKFISTKIDDLSSRIAAFDERFNTSKNIKENYMAFLRTLKSDSSKPWMVGPIERRLYEETPEYKIAQGKQLEVDKKREELVSLSKDLVEPTGTRLLGHSRGYHSNSGYEDHIVKNEDGTLEIVDSKIIKVKDGYAKDKEIRQIDTQRRIKDCEDALKNHQSKKPLIFGREDWEKENKTLLEDLNEKKSWVELINEEYRGYDKNFQEEEQSLTTYVDKVNKIIEDLKSRGLYPEIFNSFDRSSVVDKLSRIGRDKINLDPKDMEVIQFANKIYNPN